MAKITTISIQNFKFFADRAIIQLDAKHLLLFGENGSGKSSIYWSVYTLLEAANKTDSTSLKKYFDKDNDENLLNINLNQTDAGTPESHIEIILDDGSSHLLSLAETSIIGNNSIQESNWASDFINYRHLLNISYFNHSQEIDLFPYFRYTILPYVKYSTTSIYKNGTVHSSINANEITEYVFNELGPPKSALDKDGNNHYPTKTSADYQQFQRAYNSAEKGLNDLLRYINTEGNPILKDELGYDIAFKLSLESTSFKLTKRNYTQPSFKVILTIPSYLGHTGKIKRAQSFLNEAKLTAIALAIRLAVLKKTLSTNSDALLKILVLDDLMISLDMSNREKVLDLLMNKYRHAYQILLMTHDRSFFDDAKNYIGSCYATDDQMNNDWEVLEMYQAKSMEGFPIPYITKHKSPIQKAYYYFNEHIDYNACGNNLRSALEYHFRNFIPSTHLIDGQGNPIDPRALMLDGLITKAEIYFDYVGFNKDCLDKLKRYKSRSLNPTSHYNPRSNFYRKELEDIFKIYNELKNLRNDPLIGTNETLSFTVETQEGDNYTYTVQLLDDLNIYNKNDESIPDILNKDERSYGLISYAKNADEPSQANGNENNKTLQELYELTAQKISETLNQNPIIQTDMKEVFRTANGKTIRTKCDEYNAEHLQHTAVLVPAGDRELQANPPQIEAKKGDEEE